MKLYGLKNCDTCRKAHKFLKEKGIDVEFVDVRADGAPEADLRRFLAAFGERSLNRRSATWRNLDGEERSGEPLALLVAHPALMKRPVIDDGNTLHLGWNEEVRGAILGRKRR